MAVLLHDASRVFASLENSRKEHRVEMANDSRLGLESDELPHGRGEHPLKARFVPPLAALFRRLRRLHERLDDGTVADAEVVQEGAQVVLRDRDLAALDAHDLRQG